MARKPIVAGDLEAWSTILNEYLDVSHNADGTQKSAAMPSHAHATTDITSGTMAIARLGSGTASSSTYLRGDSTWAAMTGGNVDPGVAGTSGQSLMQGTSGPVWALDVFNVRAFGAVGNGVADDTVAVRAAATALAASVRTDPSVSNDGRPLATATLYFPPGSYRITSEDALMVMPASASRGFTLRGAGREATEILWAPSTSAGYLMRNQGTGWLANTFENVTFTCETTGASFLMSDAGNPSNAVGNYVFSRCNWRGAWGAGVHLKGIDNNSENAWHDCGIYGSYANGYYWAEDSDQSVSNTFVNCHAWISAGTFVRHTKGGNTYFRAGSLISTSASPVTFFRLEGSSHNVGTCNLHVSDTRGEWRYTATMFVDSEWNYGTLRFTNLDFGSQAFNVPGSTVHSRFAMAANTGTLPTIVWESCTLGGRHEYRYDDESYKKHNRVSYSACEIANHATPDAFILVSPVGAATLAGGAPLIHFDDQCLTFTNNTKLPAQDLNWRVNSRAMTSRKMLNVRRWDGTNTMASGFIDAVLPLGAVIVGARLYAPAFGTSTSTTWSLTFQTTETAPTTILTAATGTALSNGFNVQSSTLWIVCDTDVRRTVRLIANSTLDQSTTAFIGFIEYIG